MIWNIIYIILSYSSRFVKIEGEFIENKNILAYLAIYFTKIMNLVIIK